jgi:hypothetical protein
MQKSLKNIYLLLSVLFLIASIFLFFFLYKETMGNDETSKQAETAWQTEADRRNEIKSLDLSIAEIEPERALFETHFVPSSDIVPFLDTIETLATEAGAKSEVSSVVVATDNSGLIVNLDAIGSFQAVYKFLTLLENSPYELEFDSVGLQNVTIDPGTGKNKQIQQWQLSLVIKLLTFIP